MIPNARQAPMRNLTARAGALLLGLCVGLSAGCKPAAQAGPSNATAKPAAETSSVMIDSVNYMHQRGVKYTAYDLSKASSQAIGGAIVEMLGTGGEKGCCVALPRTWRPGMKVRVVWGEADRERTYPEEYTRDLEIPRYEQPADLYVVFYPDHEVELVVSAAEPGHADWSGRLKKTPWEQCVEVNGRKPCKAALPKQFDTNAKGVCTYFKQENRPDGDEKCLFLMDQCMKDYEDEPFCKGILWGEYKK